LCRYAPPATYSPALPAFYLSVKNRFAENEIKPALSEAKTLLGERKN
jgi:hypothetical protein